MDKINYRKNLVNLLFGSILGAGILISDVTRADSFSRILGTSLENAGHPDSGNYFKSVADNEDAYQVKKKLDELKEIEEKKLKLEEENKKAKEAKEAESARRRLEEQKRKVSYSSTGNEESRTSVPKKRTFEEELSYRVVFTFNRWIDLDEDRLCDYNELQGVKNSFRTGEEFRIYIQNGHTSPKFTRGVVYGPAGEKLMDLELILDPKEAIGVGVNDWETYFKPIANKGGIGSYKVAVYFDNKLVETHDFEIKGKSDN